MGDPTIVTDAERELLYRVASTPNFQKAKRLRELLLYIGEKSLRDPHCILHEQDIGVDVLGRPPDYDTSHDTLVRVQVSQLRKKLQEHFAGEGRNESIIIEIPKGSYLPVFKVRQDEHPEPAGNFISAKHPHGSGSNGISSVQTAVRSRKYALVLGCAAAVIAVLALAYSLYQAKAATASKRPTVDAFWRQVFDNSQPTNLVMSDITLIPFEKSIGQQIQLSEYESKEFERLADQNVANSVQRGLVKEVVNRIATSIADVEVARDFGVLASENHLPLNLMSARDMSSEIMSSQNSIILGSWRANPWVGLFEGQMNFRTEYHESPPSMRFINTAPLRGEEKAYDGVVWRRYGYCRVAYLSNPRHTGNVLVISGSDVISTQAGGRFISTEASILDLRQKLGLSKGEPFPHFEILLRTQIVNNVVTASELIAYRPYK